MPRDYGDLRGGAVSYEVGTPVGCCRANMAHVRQRGPHSGPGFRAKGLNTFKFFAARLEAVKEALFF